VEIPGRRSTARRETERRECPRDRSSAAPYRIGSSQVVPLPPTRRPRRENSRPHPHPGVGVDRATRALLAPRTNSTPSWSGRGGDEGLDSTSEPSEQSDPETAPGRPERASGRPSSEEARPGEGCDDSRRGVRPTLASLAMPGRGRRVRTSGATTTGDYPGRRVCWNGISARKGPSRSGSV